MNPSQFPMIPNATNGSGTLVGDSMQLTMGAYPPLYKRGTEEWLSNGTLLTYSAKYSELIKKVPGLAVCYADTTVSASTTYSGTEVYIYKNTNYYYIIALNRSDGVIQLLNANLIGTLVNSTYSSIPSYVNDAIKIPSNGYIFLGGNNGVYYYTDISGSASETQAYSQFVTCLATNNTSYVITCRSTSNTPYNTSGSLYRGNLTGGGFTSMTPTGGINKYVKLVHYSPAAGCFLVMCDNGDSAPAINKTVDCVSTVGTVTVFPSGTPTVPWANVSPIGGSREAASSPTVTLIKVSNNKFIRTTDGNTFTLVDLASQNLAGFNPDATYKLLYDSTNNYFIAYPTLLPVFYPTPTFYYSTDGVTWKCSRKLFGPNTINGQATSMEFFISLNEVAGSIISYAYTSSGGTNRLQVYGSKPYNTTTHVGIVATSFYGYQATNYTGTYLNTYTRVA